MSEANCCHNRSISNFVHNKQKPIGLIGKQKTRGTQDQVFFVYQSIQLNSNEQRELLFLLSSHIEYDKKLIH